MNDNSKNLYPFIPLVMFIVAFFFMDWIALSVGCFCGIFFSALVNGHKIRAYDEITKNDSDIR